MATNTSHEQTVQTIPQKGFFGHPRGLGVLFFVEFWERFSYYGMRAMLIFYMYFALKDGGLGIDQTTAMSIMSVYGALIYMSSIPGAWIADRLTGTRGATLIGAVLIIIGHICLSLPFAMFGLFSSMFFIIIGSGLMKPNISNIVGRLYPENDTRMDAGFVIFYMSVNLGALISPIVLQHFIDIKNFHAGFLIAAIGMALGLVWYMLFNRKNLGTVGMKPTNPLSAEEKRKYGLIVGIVVAIIVIVLVVTYFTQTLTFDLISNTVLVLGIALPIIYFTTMIRSKDVTDVERSRVKAFIPLFILGMLFWAIQEQGSNVLNIYGLERSDMQMNLFGWKTQFGEAWFQSINPLFILLFAPVVSTIWLKMGKRQPSLPVKFGIGTLLAGASYILMGVIGMSYGNTHFSVNWVILSYVVCVVGELCLSPTGNSAAVKLAPKAFNAQMMSIWLLTNASAQALNGTLVKLIKPLGQTNYFIFLGAVAIVITIIILAFTPKISKAMKGIH
ncbi:putative proton-dependent oligopeptide transport protein [Staphylococcus petrasii]|uniref:Peptide MFS transporter n=1 Tax=Staphylococcus petrasii TaxID=1276936 RepID=A0A380G3Q0_9STAP|nr:S-Cys-Gly-3M3SH uptake peptide MFS transporter [Staphylococcus petrasii]MCI2773661.1 S-Cys-Gly-3M3SH uptake peptide MFS transporter [Staphylococcus petrasii]PNZ32026.1 peptide ABC transporter permease [Staphylococcus petrasii]TGE13014.1 peptide MFS transporter [Staphylococcus petrasii]TGE18802.1 peptide MFS transporter [Staphylococcus petrasii]SUM44893.1 putative proton-dependent oligopeptide transport protein [Staphylococcus petrasii]